jgi:hypothetical protein
MHTNGCSNNRDVQITERNVTSNTIGKPLPEKIYYSFLNYKEAKHIILLNEMKRKQRGRKVSVTDSSVGNHLFQIGSRQSTQYIRVYEKKDKRNNFYTRYEVEIKGHKADILLKRLVSQSIKACEGTLASVLEESILSLNLNTELLRPHLANVQKYSDPNYKGLKKARKISTSGGTLEWWEKSFFSSANRLVRNPSTRRRIIEIIKSLYVEISAFEDLSEDNDDFETTDIQDEDCLDCEL